MKAVLIALLLPLGAMAAAPLAANVQASAQSVQLGEPFTVMVRLEHERDERYEFIAPTDEGGAFELLGQERQRSDADARAVTTFTLSFALFELEAQTLPPLRFDVTSPQGVERIELPGPTITGAATLSPDAVQQGVAPKDLKPPVDVPVRSWRLVWIAAGVLFGVLLLVLLLRQLKRWRSRLERPVVVLPLAERTRASLESLKAEHLPSQGRTREFYFRLSEILRGHLGERYGFEALECTGSELLERVQRLEAPELPREELRTFVQESDLVKFAKMDVDPGACDAALNFGFKLVDRTEQRPVAPPSSPPDVPQPRVP